MHLSVNLISLKISSCFDVPNGDGGLIVKWIEN